MAASLPDAAFFREDLIIFFMAYRRSFRKGRRGGRRSFSRGRSRRRGRRLGRYTVSRGGVRL